MLSKLILLFSCYKRESVLPSWILSFVSWIVSYAVWRFYWGASMESMVGVFQTAMLQHPNCAPSSSSQPPQMLIEKAIYNYSPSLMAWIMNARFGSFASRAKLPWQRHTRSETCTSKTLQMRWRKLPSPPYWRRGVGLWHPKNVQCSALSVPAPQMSPGSHSWPHPERPLRMRTTNANGVNCVYQ